jgi:ornithine cyclodeaminase/alanine dehydrogenase-like protein (mu-crystallin family)
MPLMSWATHVLNHTLHRSLSRVRRQTFKVRMRRTNIGTIGRRLLSTGLPAPRLFDYTTITTNLKPSKLINDGIESAFGMLAKGEVDVPIPMHIGINESANAGPGDCHIKGGYIEGTGTWTVKLANVSFYKNIEKGLAPGSGIFVVCNAVNGAPLGIFQENRYLTDLRTGAAGALSVKHFGSSPKHNKVAFIGTGVIAMAMAEASNHVHKFSGGLAYGLDPKMSQAFCDQMSSKLGYPFEVCATAEEAVRKADVIFTQTTGAGHVLQLDWLKPHATIIASGSDQPTKNELPSEVMKKSKFVADLIRQCSRVGELRTAIKEGVMQESDVHAELGEVVNGTKTGREGDELIVVDLTGTGAQDAAIGQIAWDVLSKQ